MQLIVSIAAVVALLLPATYTYAFSEKGQDCAKCHTLSKEDALTMLTDFGQNLKILEVRPGPASGMWEVDVDAAGKKGLVYIHYSKKYVLLGELYDLKGKKSVTRERLLEINKVDVSQIPLDDALVMGDRDAKYRVIVFDDPDCPYCGKLHQEMKKVIAERKDISFYIKMFPLNIHPQAYEKSKAIVCAKSLAMLEDAFEKKELPKATCETTAVDANIKLAEKLGIGGTPALIMPDGRLIPGYAEAPALIELITKQ